MMIKINNLPKGELKKYVVCTRDPEEKSLWYFDDTDKIYLAEKQLNEAGAFPRVIIDREDIENGEVNSNRV